MNCTTLINSSNKAIDYVTMCSKEGVYKINGGGNGPNDRVIVIGNVAHYLESNKITIMTIESWSKFTFVPTTEQITVTIT